MSDFRLPIGVSGPCTSLQVLTSSRFTFKCRVSWSSGRTINLFLSFLLRDHRQPLTQYKLLETKHIFLERSSSNTCEPLVRLQAKRRLLVSPLFKNASNIRNLMRGKQVYKRLCHPNAVRLRFLGFGKICS
jgi:hypothetical protein